MGLENFWIPKKETTKHLDDEIADFDNNKVDYEADGEWANTSENFHAELIETTNLLEKENISLDEVYDWYAVAISRRGREPLEREAFINHFEGYSTDETFAYGESEKGYLLGYVKYGVFVPTHFAPRTMRGGYFLMKELGDSPRVPAVLAVTEDLAETLSKMPAWQKLDVDFLAAFRSEVVGKTIMYNTHPDTKNLMLGLVAEYLEEAQSVEAGSDDSAENITGLGEGNF